MAKPNDYGALNTKLAVIKRKMLKPEDYKVLIEKTSIKDLVVFLREKEFYKDVLKDLSIEDVHRGDFEVKLKSNALQKMKDFKNYLKKDKLKFYKTMFMRYEVEDLKLILRTISRGDNIDEIQEDLLRLEYKNIDYKKIQQSLNVESFVENLRETIYYYPLRNLTQEDMESREFHMEMNLENVYFKSLYKESQNLLGVDKKIVGDLLGINIDLINLQFIYRAKKYYNISPEEILNYCIGKGKQLNYIRLKDLIYTSSIDEFLNKTMNIRLYRELFSNMNAEDDFETKIIRFLNKIFLKYKKEYPFSISGIIYFIHILEYEIRDITTITEAIRYKIDTENIKKYLIKSV